MPRAICFHVSQHAENETKSRKRWFWLACKHRGILVGYLKSFRFMSVMMVQTKCKLNNTELFLKLFHIQCKKNWKQQVLRSNNRTCEMAEGDIAWISLTLERKWRLEAECLNTFVKGRLSFSYKSTTAANFDRTESLLDNWQKNNHIAVDKIYYLRSLFVFFYKFISQPQKTGTKKEACGNPLKLDLSE